MGGDYVKGKAMTVNQNWTDNGDHDGGVSYGPGYTISWQRGPLNEAGRNGAFMIEVLESCREQMIYYQSSKYACQENIEALAHLERAIASLESRRTRRANAGTLGTHQADT